MLDAVKLVTHAVSLGDVRSLIVHPASTTHSTMPAEDARRRHITDGLLRAERGHRGRGGPVDGPGAALGGARRRTRRQREL